MLPVQLNILNFYCRWCIRLCKSYNRTILGFCSRFLRFHQQHPLCDTLCALNSRLYNTFLLSHHRHQSVPSMVVPGVPWHVSIAPTAQQVQLQVYLTDGLYLPHDPTHLHIRYCASARFQSQRNRYGAYGASCQVQGWCPCFYGYHSFFVDSVFWSGHDLSRMRGH